MGLEKRKGGKKVQTKMVETNGTKKRVVGKNDQKREKEGLTQQAKRVSQTQKEGKSKLNGNDQLISKREKEIQKKREEKRKQEEQKREEKEESEEEESEEEESAEEASEEEEESEEEEKIVSRKEGKSEKEEEKEKEKEEEKEGPLISEELSFSDLGVCETLVKTCHDLNYKRPTIIQAESLPHTLQGRDVIGLAETGSGKTLAFALPIIQALLTTPQKLFGCVLAPTRELAFQIAEHFEAVGAGIGLTCVVIVGGIDTMSQAVALAKKPHVIVATPGRLVWHLQQTKGFSLRSIRYLVMDEADRLLNLDFEEEINTILKVAPKERTTLMFSATMTSKVAKLQRASLVNPVKVEVSSKYQTVKTLIQNYIFVPAKFKDCYLTFLLNEFSGKLTIVFVSTCVAATRVAIMLRHLGFGAIPIHGKMTQPKRLAALNKFKSGDRNILIATDVASRGLDIPLVDLVINLDIPSHSKDYIHRVGRTARAGKAGRSIAMVTQYDVELLQKIESLIGEKMKLFPTESGTVLILLERVTEAQRYAALEVREQNMTKKEKAMEGMDDFQDDGEEGGAHLFKKRKRDGGGGNRDGGRKGKKGGKRRRK